MASKKEAMDAAKVSKSSPLGGEDHGLEFEFTNTEMHPNLEEGVNVPSASAGTGPGQGHEGHHQYQEVGGPGPAPPGLSASVVAETVSLMESFFLSGKWKSDPRRNWDHANLVREEILRMTQADLKREGRRKAWKEEVRRVVGKREEFKKAKTMMTPGGKQMADDNGVNEKAKATMSMMSLKWRQKFEDDRTRFLLHGVAEALQSYANRNVKDIMSSLTVAREFLQSSRDALTCRLVCKSWKGSIDNALSAPFTPFMGYRFNWGKPVLCYDTLPTFHDMAPFNFRTKQRYAEQNPLKVNRKINIGGGGVLGMKWKDNLPYYREIERLLQNWGGELWQAFIHFDNGMCPELIYEQLVKYLKLMPNLRHLTVYDSERSGDNPKPLTKKALGPLRDRIVKKPLPELPHLTSFSFNAFVPPPIIHAALTNYQSQLEFVAGKLGDERDEFGITVSNTISNSPEPAPFEGTFPSLKELRLVYQNVKGSADVENVFRNLRSLSHAPLRELRLVVTGIANGRPIYLPHNFSKRLSLKLPHLEKLFLSLYLIDLKDLDWLSECVSLKELDLNYFGLEFEPALPEVVEEEMSSSSTGATPRETIKFEGLWYRLYESNIWRMFPELRKVSIKINSEEGTIFSELYTREGFKRQQHRN